MRSAKIQEQSTHVKQVFNGWRIDLHRYLHDPLTNCTSECFAISTTAEDDLDGRICVGRDDLRSFNFALALAVQHLAVERRILGQSVCCYLVQHGALRWHYLLGRQSARFLL